MDEKSLGPHATALQQAQIQEKKNVFYRKVVSWQEIQPLYIPAVTVLRMAASREPDDPLDVPDVSIDRLTLLLPSNIGEKVPWNKQLGEYEWDLREAQARDSLDKVRQNLRLRDFLLKKKKDWSRGVRENTRSQTAIAQATNKVTAFATKYRVARVALGILAPLLGKEDAWNSEFPILHDDDIKGLPAEGWGEGTRKLSWIWMSRGVSDPDTDEPQLIDGLYSFDMIIIKFTNSEPYISALRIQWCRSRARSLRWSEEVLLVQEEMRRVTAFLHWYASWWLRHADVARRYDDPILSEGLAAYALRQAKLRTSLQDQFSLLWKNVSSWIAADDIPEDTPEDRSSK